MKGRKTGTNQRRVICTLQPLAPIGQRCLKQQYSPDRGLAVTPSGASETAEQTNQDTDS